MAVPHLFADEIGAIKREYLDDNFASLSVGLGTNVLLFMNSAQRADYLNRTFALDLTGPVQAAINSFGGGYNAGAVFFPLGGAKVSFLSVPGRVSLYGLGIGSEIRFTSTGDTITWADNSTVGGTFCRDLYLHGPGALTTARGVVTVPGNDANLWLQGFELSGCVIDGFGIAGYFKNLRHGEVRHNCVVNVAQGFKCVGQTVSTPFSNNKIVSGVGVYNDGNIGFECVSATYSDLSVRQPEAIRIDNETLIYGFDHNVYIKDCIDFTCDHADLDAALQYAFRAGAVTGMKLSDSYLGAIHQPGFLVKPLFLNDLAAPLNTQVEITNNRFVFYGITVAGSNAAYLGTNRTGICKLTGNDLGGGSAAAIALQMAGTNKNWIIEDNQIYGTAFSLVEAAGAWGNIFNRNQFIGAMIRPAGASGLDTFFQNTGTETTQFHGAITIPAGASPKTISLASMGIATNPVVGANAFLTMKCNAFQYTGGTDRGNVWARYDGAGNIVVTFGTALGIPSGDIWLDMEAS